jgi:hypothetical protein
MRETFRLQLLGKTEEAAAEDDALALLPEFHSQWYCILAGAVA